MVRRIAGFYLLPLVSMLVPFLSLPYLSRASDDAAWAGLMTGFSLGGLASIVVGLGWPLTGANEVAVLPAHEGARVYLDSVRGRALALLATLPLVAASVWLLTPHGEFAGSLGMALSALVLGLSGAWYCVGLGRVSWLALYDALPRVLGAAVGVGVMQLGGGVLGYAVAATVFPMVGVLGLNMRATALAGERFSPRNRLLAEVRLRWSATWAEVLAGVFRIAPVSLVALGASSQVVGQYGASDRLLRMSMFAVVALGNALTPWVIQRDSVWTARRARVSLAAHTALGVVGALAFATLLAPVSGVFYGADRTTDGAVAALLGIGFLLVSIETAIIRFYVLPLRGVRPVMWAAAFGAGCALVAFPLLAAGSGVLGAAWAVVLVEAGQVVWLAAFSRRVARWRQPLMRRGGAARDAGLPR